MNKMDRTTADIVAEMQRYGITRFGELPPSALGFPDLGDNVSIVRRQGPTPGVTLQQTPRLGAIACWAPAPAVALGLNGIETMDQAARNPCGSGSSRRSASWRGCRGSGPTAVLPMIGPGVTRTERLAGWYRQTRQPKARAKPPAH